MHMPPREVSRLCSDFAIRHRIDSLFPWLYRTIRYRMERSLAKSDWLRAARLALLKYGPSEVRVERLARDLRVTKGSFYWHFKDRKDLLEHLVREWEADFPSIIAGIKGHRGPKALASLLQLAVAQAPLGEKGIVPSDAAMFTWASISPEIASRVNREEKKRIRILQGIIGDSDRTELLYLIWLGFVAKGQRLPDSRKRFPRLARTILDLFLPAKSSRKKRLRPKS
jgi:AcrR family transcriptional regulator